MVTHIIRRELRIFPLVLKLIWLALCWSVAPAGHRALLGAITACINYMGRPG